jgi:hypothetical protein
MAGFTYITAVVVIMLCTISQGYSYEPAIILEELGAVFHPIGRLITSQDRLFVHIAIPRPTYLSVPGRINIKTDCGMPPSLKRDRELMTDMRSICLEFYTAMTIYNKTAESLIINIDGKLKDINSSLESIPKKTDARQYRKKRFITGVIGLVTGAIDLGMSIHTNRRIDSFMASVQDVNSVSQRNKHVIERLTEDSITIQKALIETSDKMLLKFKRISARMDNKVDILNQKIAMIFNDLRNVESNMIRTNLALAHLAGPYTAILNQAVNNLRSYFTEITRISDGIATMSRGFLSPNLIPPRILESVLNETDQALKNERFTTLELVKIPLTEH